MRMALPTRLVKYASGLPSRLTPSRSKVTLATAARVLEDERKVAIDAVPDLAAFGRDADGLGDGELAVLGELHVGDERLDDLGGEGVRGAAEPERGDKRRDRRKP